MGPAISSTNARLPLRRPRQFRLHCSKRKTEAITSLASRALRVFRLAGRGDLLGLSAIFNLTDHQYLAETIEPSFLVSVGRNQLLQMFRAPPEVNSFVTQVLARDYNATSHAIRRLGMSASVRERLAQLLVGSLDAANHARSYFTPVAPMSTNGAVSEVFARPAFGAIGDVGRNSLRGPSDYFADAAVFKTFSITERLKLQGQFQAFNVFNHVPLGVPSASNARCIDCSGDAG